jgi:hypothetical protein
MFTGTLNVDPRRVALLNENGTCAAENVGDSLTGKCNEIAAAIGLWARNNGTLWSMRAFTSPTSGSVDVSRCNFCLTVCRWRLLPVSTATGWGR